MKKNILLFSCEPGGAESLIPLVGILQWQQDFSVHVAAYGPGLERFRAKNIACTEIKPVGPEFPEILKQLNPDLIITSATSLPHKDMSEKLLWKHAKSAGIKTIAFLDQWQNYAVRFSGITPQERLAYQPDIINCINETGRREMLAEGLDSERLLPLGHPYLSWLTSIAKTANLAEIRASLGLPKELKPVLFVSEPLEENYGNERGYTQYTALDFFASHLWPMEKNAFLMLKLHPKDNAEKYRAITKKLGANVKLLDGSVSPFACLLAADKIYGMTSVMLIEAYILKKEIISVQPGLCSQDQLVLSRQNRVKLITSEKNISAPVKDLNTTAFKYEFKKDEFLQLVRKLIK